MKSIGLPPFPACLPVPCVLNQTYFGTELLYGVQPDDINFTTDAYSKTSDKLCHSKKTIIILLRKFHVVCYVFVLNVAPVFVLKITTYQL